MKKYQIVLLIVVIFLVFAFISGITILPKSKKAVVVNVIDNTVRADSGIFLYNILDEIVYECPAELELSHSFRVYSCEGLPYIVNITIKGQLIDAIALYSNTKSKHYSALPNEIKNIVKDAAQVIFEDYLVTEIQRDSIIKDVVAKNIDLSLCNIGYSITELNINYSLDSK